MVRLELFPDTAQSINALKAATAIVSTIYEEFGLTPGKAGLGTVVQPARPLCVYLYPERMGDIAPEISNGGVYVRADKSCLYVGLRPSAADFSSVDGEIRIWTRVIDELFLDRIGTQCVSDDHPQWREVHQVYRQNMEALLMRLHTTKRRTQILEIVREMGRHYVWMVEQEQSFVA